MLLLTQHLELWQMKGTQANEIHTHMKLKPATFFQNQILYLLAACENFHSNLHLTDTI